MRVGCVVGAPLGADGDEVVLDVLAECEPPDEPVEGGCD